MRPFENDSTNVLGQPFSINWTRNRSAN